MITPEKWKEIEIDIRAGMRYRLIAEKYPGAREKSINDHAKYAMGIWRNGRPPANQNWQDIEADIKTGATYPDIAKRHGVAERTIRDYAANILGIHRGNKGHAKWDWAKWDRVALDLALTPKQAEAITGIPLTTIATRRAHKGLLIRTPLNQEPWQKAEGKRRDKPELWTRYMDQSPVFFEDRFHLPANLENIRAEAARMFGGA